ncbi:glycosyltransferase family 2 protein [Ovoidimarina sediminis]|uniref:glycosyltransferase family 2 protein n=1 Tax=Ovoidimarina sediminis TaxID=3079856 RepID=UPI002914D884|nr:glycosyltransferase family 2 protein [Rhodophyticola sp. MJ-SS7]MDU8944074.1 glycosyltransferase family 2 protein [Rhodophyticola sp. MJ-SS7]
MPAGGPPRIDILLATYNGAEHLEALLASIAAQTVTGWHIIARDDGSSDGTPDMLRDWADRHPGRMTILPANDRAGGATQAFARLLEASEAPYFAFCDQDDVWLDDKLARLLDAVQGAEGASAGATPVLVHMDLRVVDDELNTLHPSFRRYMRIAERPISALWPGLLVYNTVTGCAMLGNAELRRLSAPIPAGAALHDWWLALVAQRFGTMIYLPEPGVLYRQHGGNVVGAASWSMAAIAYRLITAPGRHIAKARITLQRTRAQAAAFRDSYRDRLSPQDAALLDGYATLPGKSWIGRRLFLLRNGIYGRNALYTAIILILV